MRSRMLVVLGTLGASLAIGAAADAGDFATQSLTQADVNGIVGANTVGTPLKETIDGPSSRDYTYQANVLYQTAGSVHGTAEADFDALKVLIELNGSAPDEISGLQGTAIAALNEVFLIGGGSPGSTGFMHIEFGFGGGRSPCSTSSTSRSSAIPTAHLPV